MGVTGQVQDWPVLSAALTLRPGPAPAHSARPGVRAQAGQTGRAGAAQSTRMAAAAAAPRPGRPSSGASRGCRAGFTCTPSSRTFGAERGEQWPGPHRAAVAAFMCSNLRCTRFCYTHHRTPDHTGPLLAPPLPHSPW